MKEIIEKLNYNGEYSGYVRELIDKINEIIDKLSQLEEGKK